MALYKNPKVVIQNSDKAFDEIWEPGQTPGHPGIYRCLGCGKEITSNKDNTLPPQNHHQHTATQGKIRWQMVVYAQTDPQ